MGWTKSLSQPSVGFFKSIFTFTIFDGALLLDPMILKPLGQAMVSLHSLEYEVAMLSMMVVYEADETVGEPI